MTPEEYIEKLKSAQRTIDTAKENIDKAIDKMQQRIETGDESMEEESRILANLAGRGYLGLADGVIYAATTSKIE